MSAMASSWIAPMMSSMAFCPVSWTRRTLRLMRASLMAWCFAYNLASSCIFGCMDSTMDCPVAMPIPWRSYMYFCLVLVDSLFSRYGPERKPPVPAAVFFLTPLAGTESCACFRCFYYSGRVFSHFRLERLTVPGISILQCIDMSN